MSERKYPNPFGDAERYDEYSDLKNRIVTLGFQPEDLENIDRYSLYYAATSYKETYTDEVFKFVAGSARNHQERSLLLENMAQDPTTSGWVSSVRLVVGARENGTKRLDETRSVIQKTMDLYLDTKRNSAVKEIDFYRHIRRSLKISGNELLYGVFDYNAEAVTKFITDISTDRRHHHIDSNINSLLEFATTSKLAHTLFDGVYRVNQPNLSGLLVGDISSYIYTEKRAKLVNGYLRSSGSWSDKINAFLKFLKSEDVPVVSRELFDKNLVLLWAGETAKSAKVGSGITTEKILEAADDLSPEKKAELILTLSGQFSDKYSKVQKMAINSISQKEKPDLLTLAGITVETMERIQRRENRFHPLNTLKIAQTVGHEVEYGPSEIDSEIRTIGGFKVLDILGFKSGDGGRNEVETSPGPFYDPLTAITIFNLYTDAGFIQRTRHAQTMHFNVGILPAPTDELILLVKAMYASGFSSDPNIGERNGHLLILENEDHTEGKVFDVVSSEGFAWTMETASFLSWAIAAEVGKRNGADKWHKELAIIWRDFVNTLDKGFASIGLNEYLHSGYMFDNSSVKVKNQLKEIFPNVASLSHRDVSKVSSPSLPVVLSKGVRYSNIAHFVREVTNSHVLQIKYLADRVEYEVKADISRTDKLRGGEKLEGIRIFIKKYNTPVDDDSDASYEKSYMKVRSVFRTT